MNDSLGIDRTVCQPPMVAGARDARKAAEIVLEQFKRTIAQTFPVCRALKNR
jgi:hypothetical protein